MSRDKIAELVARTRRDQGLPPTIEDPAVLSRVAALLHSKETAPAEAGAADVTEANGDRHGAA